MNKITHFIKQNQLIILIALAGIACFIFYDHLIEIIIGAFGLGGAAIAAKKQQAKESLAVADEHESLMSQSVESAVLEMKKADELRQKSVDIAKSIEPMPDKPKAGTKRKKFTSR